MFNLSAPIWLIYFTFLSKNKVEKTIEKQRKCWEMRVIKGQITMNQV